MDWQGTCWAVCLRDVTGRPSSRLRWLRTCTNSPALSLSHAEDKSDVAGWGRGLGLIVSVGWSVDCPRSLGSANCTTAEFVCVRSPPLPRYRISRLILNSLLPRKQSREFSAVLLPSNKKLIYSSATQCVLPMLLQIILYIH